MPQQDRLPLFVCVCVRECICVYVCVLCGWRDGPLQSVSIWKHSVLVCCLNWGCVGCLNSHITQRGRHSHTHIHIHIHTQRPTRHTVYTDRFCFPLSSGGPTDGQRDQLSNSALKIEPLKRVGTAAGDETSADKRQEKRAGDGTTWHSSPFCLEAQEKICFVGLWEAECLTKKRLGIDHWCLSRMCVCVSLFMCVIVMSVCWYVRGGK